MVSTIEKVKCNIIIKRRRKTKEKYNLSRYLKLNKVCKQLLLIKVARTSTFVRQYFL